MKRVKKGMMYCIMLVACVVGSDCAAVPGAGFLRTGIAMRS